ncbi:MAG: helix-turn-helix domain-containing protein [Bacilli bacterium]
MKNILGNNLRKYRYNNNLTLKEVADYIGVSHTTVKNYEDGVAVPPYEKLQALAKLYDTTVFEFNKEFIIEKIDFEPLFNDGKFLVREEKKLREVITEEINEYIKVLHMNNMGSFNNFNKIIVGIKENIENIVNDIRHRLNISDDIPLYNLISLLEKDNIHVITIEKTENFTSFSTLVNTIAFIVVSEDENGAVFRYNLAKGLGKLMIVLREDNEELYDEFAKSFLLPRESLIEDLGIKRNLITIDELIILKNRYNVSKKLILDRLLDLEIITNYRYKELNSAIKKSEDTSIIKSEENVKYNLLKSKLYNEGLVTNVIEM